MTAIVILAILFFVGKLLWGTIRSIVGPIFEFVYEDVMINFLMQMGMGRRAARAIIHATFLLIIALLIVF